MNSELEGTRTRDQDAAMREVDGNGEAARGPWRRLLPALILVAGFALFFLLGLDRYLSFEALAEHRHWLTAQVEQNAVTSAVIYAVAYAVMAAFSIPGGALLTILGGFLFGTWLGTLYAVLGATAGSIAVFLAARTALGDMLRRKAGRAVQKMQDGFREHALSYLLVLRLIPIFPFWLVNLVPAFVGVPLATYVVGTFAGIIPGTFVYASLGNGVGALMARGETPDLTIIFAPEILTPILGLCVLAMLPVAYKRWRRRRAGSPDGG